VSTEKPITKSAVPKKIIQIAPIIHTISHRRCSDAPKRICPHDHPSTWVRRASGARPPNAASASSRLSVSSPFGPGGRIAVLPVISGGQERTHAPPQPVKVPLPINQRQSALDHWICGTPVRSIEDSQLICSSMVVFPRFWETDLGEKHGHTNRCCLYPGPRVIGPGHAGSGSSPPTRFRRSPSRPPLRNVIYLSRAGRSVCNFARKKLRKLLPSGRSHAAPNAAFTSSRLSATPPFGLGHLAVRAVARRAV
jgi:hypothetical protein